MSASKWENKQKLLRWDLNILVSIWFHGRMFIGDENTPWLSLEDERSNKQIAVSSEQVDSARGSVCIRCFILLSSLRRTRSFFRNAYLYCYVIYLNHPRREGMRTLQGISERGTGGVSLLFTLANFASREATRPGLQGDAQFRTFPFDKRASLSETLAPRESLRSQEGTRQRSENERATRGRVSILSDGRD